MSDATAQLGAELEAALVRALRREWQTINYSLFRGKLTTPQLVLSDAQGRLGCWKVAERMIEIARHLVFAHPWGVVVEVLKHEMAHQYTDEVLGSHGETSHGARFVELCQRLGIDATASGLPRSASAGGDDDRLPRRIAKLLALADSPNVHEAEAAMREAQRLMLKYNIDVARHPGPTPRRYGFRHVGEPTGRLQPHQRMVGAILGRFFFVETIWVSVYRPLLGKTGTVLEVCGTEENLEMAAYVHDFLLHSAERLWQGHKRSAKLTSDRDRRSYLVGVMRGFFDKLETAESTSHQEGLVWVGDADLTHYLRQRHPQQRTVHSQARTTSAAAFAHGRRAGQDLVLHKPITSGSTQQGLKLPPRRSAD